MDLDEFIDSDVDLIVCMRDTLIHLDSAENVALLLSKAYSSP